MGIHWSPYPILLLGVVLFWSFVRFILEETHWRRIKEHDKFKITALGRQQLEVSLKKIAS